MSNSYYSRYRTASPSAAGRIPSDTHSSSILGRSRYDTGKTYSADSGLGSTHTSNFSRQISTSSKRVPHTSSSTNIYHNAYSDPHRSVYSTSYTPSKVPSSYSTPSLAPTSSHDSSGSESDLQADTIRRLSDLNHSDNNSKMSKKGLTGLRNLGNTCFMNSMLQCLAHTKPLIEFFLKGKYENEINSGAKTAHLVKTFSVLISKLWSTIDNDPPVNPAEFKNAFSRHAPRFTGYSQQDSQEFLIYLLEGLHDGLNRVKKRPKLDPSDYKAMETMPDKEKSDFLWKRYLKVDDSFISSLFMGQLKSLLVCDHCKTESTVYDPFWHLSLPIPRRHISSTTVSDCFGLFSSEEQLDGDEKPKCDKCKTRRKCYKTLSLQRLPKILVLQLMRFSGDRYRTKLNTKVDYPRELDVRPFCERDCIGKTEYSLFAVSEHSGTPNGGHYTASVLHPYSKKWYSCNDTRVSSISFNSAVSSEGYVLFYEQME